MRWTTVFSIPILTRCTSRNVTNENKRAYGSSLRIKYERKKEKGAARHIHATEAVKRD